MLQQTRVATVIPYYDRFLKRFPDALSLASAPESELLEMWSGLGYYSRARNLQKAARQIVETGAFPRAHDAILKLSGVGDYTAAAIASIAFGQPHAAVDGNVKRVAARFTNDGTADSREWADRWLDPDDPGRWNQAVMELGATVCLPRAPLCPQCPIARQCLANRAGTQNDLPLKKVKQAPERLTKTLLFIRTGRQILVTPSKRVPGFWDLPEPFPGARQGATLGEFSHTITHRQYRFTVKEAKAARHLPHCQWLHHGLPLSTIAKKALRIAYNAP